jgi:hypothetical protein
MRVISKLIYIGIIIFVLAIGEITATEKKQKHRLKKESLLPIIFMEQTVVLPVQK